MATKKKLNYTIQAHIVLDTDIEISADSLEDAVLQSKSLKIEDFIEIHGGHNDSRLVINGVNGHLWVGIE